MRKAVPAPAPTTVSERRLYAMGLRLCSTALLACMGALIKATSETGVKLPELMFWRQAFAVPVILIWAAMTIGLPSLQTHQFKLHLRRCGMSLVGMSLNFGAVLLLPLAEATTISFTVPLFATILAALLLGERVGKHRWLAVACGFLGIIVVTQPGRSPIPLDGALVALCSSFMVALISTQIRDMAKTEGPVTITFWFSFLGIFPLGLILPWFSTPLDGQQWLMLIGIGILGAGGQMMLTASLRYAPLSTVVAMDYSALIWSTLIGYIWWDHLPPNSTWVGAPIIVASSGYIFWRERRLSIERAAETAA
jgi:drug/metabolite transporter (DMT)-like permease